MDSQQSRRIIIYREGQSLKVAPPQCEVSIGDPVIFRNTTTEDVVLLFPNMELFEKSEPVMVEAGAKSETLGVKTVAYGVYPYAVYSLDKREFAHASVPIIIIYPND